MMKSTLFGIVAVMAVASAMAQRASDIPPSVASDIPPHTEVVSKCGKITSVHLISSSGIHRYDSSNSTPTQLKSLAQGAPHNMWYEVGCQR